MGNHVNKLSYLNLLPKEVRLNIAGKLGIDQFIEFNEYLTDVIDIGYTTILREYSIFNDIIDLIKYFPEFPKLYTWRDIYICMKIDLTSGLISKFKEMIDKYTDISSFLFLFDIKLRHPVFYNDMVNICLSHGRGLLSFKTLGITLGRIYDTHHEFFEKLISDELTGAFPDKLSDANRLVISDDMLIYYLVGRKDSKMRWGLYVDIGSEVHYKIFNELLELKVTDWIENIGDHSLIVMYYNLKNNNVSPYDTLYIDVNINLKPNGMTVIRAELTRRGIFDHHFGEGARPWD